MKIVFKLPPIERKLPLKLFFGKKTSQKIAEPPAEILDSALPDESTGWLPDTEHAGLDNKAIEDMIRGGFILTAQGKLAEAKSQLREARGRKERDESF